MEFVKIEDVQQAINEAYSLADLQDKFNGLKRYKAEYKAHMPIRIRDHTGENPVEYDCGEDLEHHRLVVGAGGELGFYNPQEQTFSCNLNYAESLHECCFVPNRSTGNEHGRYNRWEFYIAPERLLVLKEVGDEAV